MKETIDKIKSKYGAFKTELLLMLLFVCAFLLLNWGPGGEASPASGSSVTEMSEEDGFGAGGSTGGGSDKNAGSGNENDKAAGGEADGTGDSDGSGSDKNADSGSDKNADSENENAGADGADSGDSAEETARSLRKTLAAMPEGFVYPMVFPEQEPEQGLQVYSLEDTRRLHGYRLLIPAEELAEKEDSSLALLKTMLENRIDGYDGEWSVYVKNLDTDESFVIHDEPMKSASVMKLFIMGTVYEAFASGELERTDEVMGLMRDMISVSDNESANQLLYRLGNSSYAAGIQRVNQFISEHGFSKMTVEYNGFNNSATNTDSSHNNQVAAKDCGKLLEEIYHREWMNRSVSNEVEEMMLNQHTRYKIPAGLPEGVSCGNKSGEMDSTENDAAIIYGEKCDYILVVLSGGWNSRDEAVSRIASISAAVYEFLN